MVNNERCFLVTLVLPNGNTIEEHIFCAGFLSDGKTVDFFKMDPVVTTLKTTVKFFNYNFVLSIEEIYD